MKDKRYLGTESKCVSTEAVMKVHHATSRGDVLTFRLYLPTVSDLCPGPSSVQGLFSCRNLIILPGPRPPNDGTERICPNFFGSRDHPSASGPPSGRCDLIPFGRTVFVYTWRRVGSFPRLCLIFYVDSSRTFYLTDRSFSKKGP